MGNGCSTITVMSGDGCASLAARCGISAADFTSFNPSPTLCSTLVPGQKVCCSAGGLPVPVKNSDGSCANYTVVSGDSCNSIALSNSITVANLTTWNANTWGWEGCNPLQLGNICLSTGFPPMPPAVANAECGPQVPGTANPGTEIYPLSQSMLAHPRSIQVLMEICPLSIPAPSTPVAISGASAAPLATFALPVKVRRGLQASSVSCRLSC